MKVKYIKNKHIETDNTSFPVRNPRNYLQIGKEYNVYGIMYYNDEFKYLIIGEYEKIVEDEFRTPPTWEPSELFEVVDNKLPPEWYFKPSVKLISEENQNNPSSDTWGYKELALDFYHSDRLMERNIEDINVFLKRRHEIDKWQLLRDKKK